MIQKHVSHLVGTGGAERRLGRDTRTVNRAFPGRHTPKWQSGGQAAEARDAKSTPHVKDLVHAAAAVCYASCTACFSCSGDGEVAATIAGTGSSEVWRADNGARASTGA